MSSGLYNTHKIDFDTTLDLTRLKPYGDTMNDGKVQTSFTLPIKDDERGEEAARQIAKKMGLEEEEIVILLSNLLDNAIRESEKVLKNTGKAVIHLKLECEEHKLIFAVRNPVTEKVEIENDTIKSKRGDHHGIGLLNVKAVVDKYGGDMVLSCDENEFKAVVIL